MQLICNFAVLNPEEVHTGINHSIVPWLGKTMKCIDIFMNAKFQEAGIDVTKQQMLIMQFIEHGISSQSTLCLITERNKSSLTRLIQGLEKKGYVKRKTYTQDKRQHLLNLTAQGKTTLEKTIPVVNRCFQTIEANINPQELEVVENILKKLLANTKKEINENQ